MPSQTATFSARYDQVAAACEFVAQAAVQAGFGEKGVFQVQLACDEACTNVVEHAYRGQEGHFEVTYRLDGRDFVITIRDHGRAFDPHAIPEPFIPTEASHVDLLEVGGLGLHFMRKLMDEVQFEFSDEGNVVQMVKRLPNSL
jgi:serine/threonine-protein kinase RsbW